MKKINKKTIAVLISIILVLSFFYQNEKETYASNTNKYLVLVQQKDGSWKAYENIVEESSNGSLMIKVKLVSKALGFTYKKNTNETFTIKRSTTRYNTYTKNQTKFKYTNGSNKSNRIATNIAYTSKQSKYNVCQANTLSSLVHYKYFDGSKTNDYKSYRGVICYSKYKKIPSDVPNSTPAPTKKPTPTPIPEPTTISIEGVEFPVRANFLSVEKALSDWGGTATTWSLLEQEMDGKIIKTTDLSVGMNSIEFSHLGSGSDGIYLKKASKGYLLSISVKLSGSVVADQNAAIVKAMITTISSKPSLVYRIIMDSFITDNKHGINKKTYVTVGDCKVKVKMKDGVVTYYIKGA